MSCVSLQEKWKEHNVKSTVILLMLFLVVMIHHCKAFQRRKILQRDRWTLFLEICLDRSWSQSFWVCAAHFVPECIENKHLSKDWNSESITVSRLWLALCMCTGTCYLCALYDSSRVSKSNKPCHSGEFDSSGTRSILAAVSQVSLIPLPCFFNVASGGKTDPRLPSEFICAKPIGWFTHKK